MVQELLLEELAKKCGCFISSLHIPEEKRKAVEILSQMPLENYTLTDCQACISYLFLDLKTQFQDYQEIRSFLIEQRS